MAEHMQLRDMPKFCAEIEAWLNARYGEAEGKKRWEATGRQYGEYLKELPDYGGKKTSHTLAIYGSIVIFSLSPLLPDHRRQRNCRSLSRGFYVGICKAGKDF